MAKGNSRVCCCALVSHSLSKAPPWFITYVYNNESKLREKGGGVLLREREGCMQWEPSHAARLSAHVSGGHTDVQGFGINPE